MLLIKSLLHSSIMSSKSPFPHNIELDLVSKMQVAGYGYIIAEWGNLIECGDLRNAPIICHYIYFIMNYNL